MKTRDYILCGLFTAVMCICAFITIPLFFTPIVFTLQTFAVSTAGAVLGSKKGALSIIIYTLIGICGLPVFSSMTGGIGALAGLTGGYIWGFIPEAFVCGFFAERLFNKSLSDRKNILRLFLSMIIGLIVVYACGTMQYMAISNVSFKAAIISTVLPFIPFDIVKIMLSSIVSLYIKKYMA